MFIICITFQLIITLNSKLSTLNYILIRLAILVLILIFKHREIALIA